MSYRRSDHTTYKEVTARRVLTGLAGIAGTRGITFTLLLLIALAMVGDAVDRWLKRIMAAVLDHQPAALWVDGRNAVYDAVLMTVIAAVLYWLIHKARRASLGMHLEAQRSNSPEPVQVLFLSLSYGKSPESLARVSSIDDPALAAHNWLMPALAIDHHRQRLSRIIVLASGAGGRDPASHPQIAQFAELARRLTGNAALRVEPPDDYVNTPELRQAIASGVDMDDMPQMVRALDETRRTLVDRERGNPVSADDMLFDITSGTRLSSSAMTAVALAYDNRLQYCQRSENTTKVVSYHPHFTAAER